MCSPGQQGAAVAAGSARAAEVAFRASPLAVGAAGGALAAAGTGASATSAASKAAALCGDGRSVGVARADTGAALVGAAVPSTVTASIARGRATALASASSPVFVDAQTVSAGAAVGNTVAGALCREPLVRSGRPVLAAPSPPPGRVLRAGESGTAQALPEPLPVLVDTQFVAQRVHVLTRIAGATRRNAELIPRHTSVRWPLTPWPAR